MVVIAKWAGDGLTPSGALPVGAAGAGDNAFTAIGSTAPGVLTLDSGGLRSPRIKFTNTATQAAHVAWGPAAIGSGHTTYATRFYAEWTGLASVSWAGWSGWSGATNIWRIDIAGTGGSPPGHIRIRDGASVQYGASTMGLPLGTVVRVEMTVNGIAVVINVYNGDSTTALFSVSATVSTMAPIDTIRFGYHSVNPIVPAYWHDDFALSDTAAFIGPADTTPPPTETWSLWNGSDEFPLTLDGVWTGSAVSPIVFDQIN